MERHHRYQSPPAPSVRHVRKDRAARWGGILASIVLHAIVFFLWRAPSPATPSNADSIRVIDVDASMRAVGIASLTADRAVPLARRPVLAIEMPEIETREFALSLPGSGLRRIAVTWPPPAAPRGYGSDPADAEGEATGTTLPPVPQAILMNWVVPQAVLGMKVNARVWVTSVGRAVGTVELDPRTPDRGFNRRVADRVRQIGYRPALRNGLPVPGWVEITFVFCPTTVTATSPRPRVSDRRGRCVASSSGGDF